MGYPDYDWWIRVGKFFEWERRTFPNQTRLGRMAHLVEELEELRQALSLRDIGKLGQDPSNEDSIREEIVDCIFLLMGMMPDAETLGEEMEKKLEKLKGREWGERNDQGYWKHVKET